MLQECRRFFVTFCAVWMLSSTTAWAQTDLFWNTSGSGGTGNWDVTIDGNWNNPTFGAGNNSFWQPNDGTLRANFANTAGTVTIIEPVTAYGVNFSTANYVITSSGGNTLTLAGPGGVINSNVAALISAPIAGSVGLTKTGSGSLTVNNANTYSGGTSVVGGTLIGDAQAGGGSPFSSGNVTLSGAVLNLSSLVNTATTTTVGDVTVSSTNANTVGASNLVVANTGGAPSTTFAAGNLVRGGTGSVLVITPSTGNLGTTEIATFSNGNSLLTNGILPAWVVMQGSSTNSAVDFATYNGGSGVGVASYSGSDLTTSNNTTVVNQSSVPTVAANVAAYALKTNQAINLNGNSLALGNGSGQTGLILNDGGSVTNGDVSFGSTEGMVYAQGTTTLGSASNSITSSALNITLSGAGASVPSLTINSNIVGTGVPVAITGVMSGTSLTLNGTNTYTGGTTLSVNTGATGNVFLGTDSAFGTGKVTNIIVPGTSSVQIQATGTRTLANAFDLNGGINFTGTNSITFTGPLTTINSVSGGTRTLLNMTSGGTVTYGNGGSPSTITLGNPVSNGGDGVGKTLIISSNNTAVSVVNDVFVDPAPGGGTASGSVGYGGAAGGLVQVNSVSSYTGSTFLNGGSTVQFNHDYNVGDPSGPFGLGTLVPNNGSNNILQPIGGSRTLANPVLMTTGFTVSNAASDPSAGITFTGPITFNNTRTIANNFTATTGGTLTLGSAVSPSTFTLISTSSGTQTLSISGPGKTVINDPIQETGNLVNITDNQTGTLTINGTMTTNGNMTISGSGGTTIFNAAQNANGNLSITGTTSTTTFNAPRNGPGSITMSAGSSSAPATLNLNAQSTYSGGTTLTGAGSIINIGVSSNALPGPSFTSGPFGTGTLTPNSGTNQHLRPRGGDQVIANTVSMGTGFAMDNAPGETYNLTFTGPINMTDNSARTISDGFSPTVGGGGTLTLGDPNTPNQIMLASGSGTALSFSAWAGPIVINDAIVDETTPIGTRYAVNVPGNATSQPIIFNGQSTYTTNTNVGQGGGTSPIELGTSTIGDFGSITSGPLGVGTINATGSTANPLTPLNADRTLSNRVTLSGNLGAGNVSGQTFNLNLTGPISMANVSRTITNNMAGRLVLGSVASPQTLSLGTTANVQLTFNGTGRTDINDLVANDGLSNTAGNLTVASGTVSLYNANTYGTSGQNSTTVTGGTLLVNNTSGSGTGPGNVTVSGGTIGGAGSLDGTVTLSNTAALAPGNVAPDSVFGTLNVNNSVSFGLSNAFNVDIGGSTPGTSYDQLAATTASVFGALNVTLAPSFVAPTSPTDYVIINTTGGVTGTFTSLSLPNTGGTWSVDYTNPNEVIVHTTGVPAGVPGDFNNNGIVDAGDYAVWRKNQAANLALPNDNGVGNQAARFALWRANFGKPPGAGSGGGLSGSGVPEPGTLVLVVTGLAVAGSFRRVWRGC